MLTFLACKQDTFRALHMQGEKRAVVIFASNCPLLILSQYIEHNEFIVCS
jgi:hypothetical protein